jgi:hypothetical protein
MNRTPAYSPDKMAITPTMTATHAWSSILLLAYSDGRILRIYGTQDRGDEAR